MPRSSLPASKLGQWSVRSGQVGRDDRRMVASFAVAHQYGVQPITDSFGSTSRAGFLVVDPNEVAVVLLVDTVAAGLFDVVGDGDVAVTLPPAKNVTIVAHASYADDMLALINFAKEVKDAV